ncbi:MAG: Cof-type HAD-IIB family hydrolase, partial [Candidatus Humimicrobiaceae bacterium]
MYKLLATDVDGTLLDSSSKLTELNKKALLDCIASGINVIIATGKSINSTLFIIEELGLKGPQITHGGAVIITPERKVINSVKIPAKLYLDVVQKVREKGYELVVATVDSKIYCQEYSKHMDNIAAIGEKINKADDLKSDYFRDNAVSITIPINESDPMDLFMRTTYKDKLQIVRSGEYFFDILSFDSSKGIALTSLINELGIKKEEVVSFGDSHNDISLFKASGLKIAVKNSYPELLEIADIITDENYNSGLGRAIYKYILKKELPINLKKYAYSTSI